MDWQLSLNRLIGSTKGTIGDTIKKAFVDIDCQSVGELKAQC